MIKTRPAPFEKILKEESSSIFWTELNAGAILDDKGEQLNGRL